MNKNIRSLFLLLFKVALRVANNPLSIQWKFTPLTVKLTCGVWKKWISTNYPVVGTWPYPQNHSALIWRPHDQLRNRLSLRHSLPFSRSFPSAEVTMLLWLSLHAARNFYSCHIEKVLLKDGTFIFTLFNSYSKLSLKPVNPGYFVLFGWIQSQAFVKHS